jgi:hypothetical protein
MAFAMRQRKKMRKGVGVGSDDVWKRRGGSTVTRGGSGGAWWPAPAWNRRRRVTHGRRATRATWAREERGRRGPGRVGRYGPASVGRPE